MLGINASEHTHLLDRGVELGVSHRAQLGPGHEPRARLKDSQFAGDRLGRSRMVAGDHHGTDMRALGGDHRGLGLDPRRIDHAYETQQHEVIFNAVRQLDRGASTGGGLRIHAERGGRHGARGDSQRPQRLAGKLLVALQKGSTSRVRERDVLTLVPNMAAFAEQQLGRALDENVQVLRLRAVEVHGGMTLAFRRERDFGKARIPFQLRLGHAELACSHDQGALRGVALDEPAAVLVAERGVVGERRGAQRPFECVAMRGRGIDCLAVDREVALGDVTAAADLDQRIGGGDRPHGHFVASERTGLVGADDGRGAERFDGRQLAHDGMSRCHAANAEAQPDCDYRR